MADVFISRKDVLEEAIKTVTTDRVNQYGLPEDSFGTLSDYWTTYIKSKHPEFIGGLSKEDTAWMMMLLKIARQSCGEGKLDNAVDAAGYASIAGELFHNGRLSKGE